MKSNPPALSEAAEEQRYSRQPLHVPATFRMLAVNLLHSAVQWESYRASYYKSQGQMTRSQNCEPSSVPHG